MIINNGKWDILFTLKFEFITIYTAEILWVYMVPPGALSLENPKSLRDNIDRLVQERRNSIANALELRLSCTNPSIYKGTAL